MRRTCFALVVMLMFALSSCEREDRRFREAPPGANVINTIQVSGLHPGGPPNLTPSVPNIYEENAYALSEGKRLFENFNCTGCHSHGGGGIGPPLMDPEWIYGSEPANIFATIMQGRPNGMPSFRGRIPEYQAWQIVAYVRSLSGMVRSDVAPSRSDHMYAKPAEESTPLERPTGITGQPQGKKP